VIPFLHLRARLQHRAGFRKEATSPAAVGLGKLASIIGDARTLWRIWGEYGFSYHVPLVNSPYASAGLLPIVQWLVSLEKSPPPTRSLLTIERLQGWSMLFYYPLEHLSYLVSHSILPTSVPSPRSLLGTSSKPVHLDVNKLGIWSTRFWAAYVALQFAHLREDAKLLGKRERAVLKAKGKGVNLEAEKAEVRRRWDALLNELVVNLGYLPLTIHWFVELNLSCFFRLALTIRTR
jgi:hypothetical protein